MTDRLSVIEAALAIRPQLSKLLEADESEGMKTQLDQLLQKAQAGESVENNIWNLLTGFRTTRKWVTDFQDLDRVQKRGYKPLPSSISNINSHKFKCPYCDESWSRDRVGRPTPLCSRHNVPLEPV